MEFPFISPDFESVVASFRECLYPVLISGEEGQWEVKYRGINYWLERDLSNDGTCIGDYRRLSVDVPSIRSIAGLYVQVVCLATDNESGITSCHLERSVNTLTGGYLSVRQNMNHPHAEVEGDERLNYLLEKVLDPFIGFMQMPAEYAERAL